MSREPRNPCGQPSRNYAFTLDDGRRVIQPGTSEEDAAAKIPVVFGSGVKWATGTKSGKKYEY